MKSPPEPGSVYIDEWPENKSLKFYFFFNIKGNRKLPKGMGS
jgi:hypothetical protein